MVGEGLMDPWGISLEKKRQCTAMMDMSVSVSLLGWVRDGEEGKEKALWKRGNAAGAVRCWPLRHGPWPKRRDGRRRGRGGVQLLKKRRSRCQRRTQQSPLQSSTEAPTAVMYFKLILVLAAVASVAHAEKVLAVVPCVKGSKDAATPPRSRHSTLTLRPFTFNRLRHGRRQRGACHALRRSLPAQALRPAQGNQRHHRDRLHAQ